jgi:hypothetical protein
MLDPLILSFYFTLQDSQIKECGIARLALLGEGLDNLEEIAPGICKERNAEAHCGYVVWLAGDRHVAVPQFVDGSVDTIDAETRVAPARYCSCHADPHKQDVLLLLARPSARNENYRPQRGTENRS